MTNEFEHQRRRDPVALAEVRQIVDDLTVACGYARLGDLDIETVRGHVEGHRDQLPRRHLHFRAIPGLGEAVQLVDGDHEPVTLAGDVDSESWPVTARRDGRFTHRGALPLRSDAEVPTDR